MSCALNLMLLNMHLVAILDAVGGHISKLKQHQKGNVPNLTTTSSSKLNEVQISESTPYLYWFLKYDWRQTQPRFPTFVHNYWFSKVRLTPNSTQISNICSQYTTIHNNTTMYISYPDFWLTWPMTRPGLRACKHDMSTLTSSCRNIDVAQLSHICLARTKVGHITRSENLRLH